MSGERTLTAFYQRLLPFAEPFMALFGRAKLPHPATLSRFVAALDHGSVEARRTLFQEDLVARPVFASPPGGVWDRQGKPGSVGDVDGTKQAARLALPLSHVLVRLDGLYGNAAPLADLLAAGGPGVVVRGKDYHLLDLPAVSARLHLPPVKMLSKTRTAGFLILPVGKSSGKS